MTEHSRRTHILNQYNRLKEQMLMSKFMKTDADYDKVFETAQMIEKERSALAQKCRLYKAVRTRLEQKEMEQDVPGTISVMSPAFVSSQLSQDRRIMYTVIVLMLDGLAMVFSRCLLHRRKTSVTLRSIRARRCRLTHTATDGQVDEVPPKIAPQLTSFRLPPAISRGSEKPRTHPQ